MRSEIVIPPTNTFVKATVAYDALPGDPAPGKRLGVQLFKEDAFDNPQMWFDDARSSSTVPNRTAFANLPFSSDVRLAHPV